MASKKSKKKIKKKSAKKSPKKSKKTKKVVKKTAKRAAKKSSAKKAVKKAAKKPAKKPAPKAKAASKPANAAPARSQSMDANLVACNQEHEVRAVLSHFGKSGTGENIAAVQKACQEFKANPFYAPHNRDNLYRYLGEMNVLSGMM